MELFKNICIAVTLVGFFFAFIFGMMWAEHEISPKVNGRLMGSGYECKMNVLYIVDGVGMSRTITPAFDVKTSKVIYCD